MNANYEGDALMARLKKLGTDLPASGTITGVKVRRSAGQRRRKRSYVASAAAVLVRAVAVSIFVSPLVGGGEHKKVSADESATAAPRSIGLAPACSPPVTVSLIDRSNRSTISGPITVAVGKQALITAAISVRRAVTVVVGRILVANPNSTPGVGDQSRLPSTSALLPANDLAVSPPLGAVTDGQLVDLSVDSNNSGTYQIYFYLEYSELKDCGGPDSGPTAVMEHVGALTIG